MFYNKTVNGSHEVVNYPDIEGCTVLLVLLTINGFTGRLHEKAVEKATNQ